MKFYTRSLTESRVSLPNTPLQNGGLALTALVYLRLRRDLPMRYRRGTRIQHNVRALRPDDYHVLLQK